jgi:putative peptide zinc metalloprotease protein
VREGGDGLGPTAQVAESGRRGLRAGAGGERERAPTVTALERRFGQPEHGWFLTDPVASVLVNIVAGLLLAAVHEAWHWLAGRAIGLPAVFRLSYRGVYLVFETDLSPIVTVPRRSRYGVFLAGMAFDGVVLAVALTARLGHHDGWFALPPLLHRFLGSIVLIQVIGLVWQCAALFLRNDAYAIIANALRCHNLYRATWLVNKDQFWRLTEAEAAELAEIGARDVAVARWFGVAYAIGMTVMVWFLLHFGLPFLIAMGTWVLYNLASIAVHQLAFWESLAVLLYLIALRLGPLALAVRERRLRRARRIS